VKRILLRAKKTPFEVFSAEETLEKNLIFSNSGNVVFQHVSYKLLSTREASVDPYPSRPKAADADWINERYDAYVVPLADAFRPTFERHLIALTELIERLRIPVVVLGVCARSDIDYDMDSLKPLDRSVKAFARAVLERGPSIGVRGEFSQAYLNKLGFSEVEVIGCPSMFLYGDRLPTPRGTSIGPSARLALNISPDVPTMNEVVLRHHAKYAELIYIPQEVDSLALMVWRQSWLGKNAAKEPLDLAHPLFRENKARFFLDPWPWINFMRDRDFAFGTRIHGNIVALLGGTPAFVFAHDSRTLELARYFDIPHMTTAELRPETDAADLYEAADYGAMVAGHAARFAVFAEFMHRHGLRHIFEPGEDAEAFDRRVAAVAYPPAVEVAAPGSGQLGLRRRVRYELRRLSRTVPVRRLRAAVVRRAPSAAD
jgi:hypothetical protein